MTSQADVRLLYVQDSEPGFMWAGGRVIDSAEADRRRQIFSVLGQTVRRARIDRRTPVGRVVWGRAVLIVEALLPGKDQSGRPLTLTMTVTGDIRGAERRAKAAGLASKELAAHGLEADRAGLEALLEQAQALRPGLLLAWWLDLWNSFVRTWRGSE